VLLFFVFGIGNNTWAQSTANYVFTTNATGSLAADMNATAIDMTTGTTQLVAASSDSGVSSATNIGFNFPFMGKLIPNIRLQQMVY